MTTSPNIPLTASRSETILVALRQVIRAVDLHSRKLTRSHDLTGPQAIVLRQLAGAREGLTPGRLAQRISVSQATVSDIVKRLESKDLVRRRPDPADRRRVLVELTETGRARLAGSPPLLQDTFVRRFDALDDWEQHMLVASMQRIARLVDAQEIDAEPLLSGDSLAPPDR